MRSRTLTRLALALLGLCLFLPVRAGELDFAGLIRVMEHPQHDGSQLPDEGVYRILYGSTDPRAEAAIRAGLNDTNPSVRLTCLRLLLDRGVADAPALLEAAQRDPDKNIRNEAIRLSNASTVLTEEQLLAQLRDPATKNRVGPIRMLAKCGGPATVAALAELAPNANVYEQEAIIYTLSLLGEPAVDALLHFATDPKTRVKAIERLALMSDPRALAAIEDAMHDPDPKVRYATISSLDNFPTRSSHPLRLYTALCDSEANTRNWALASMSMLTLDEQAVGPLLSLLDDPDPDIRVNAARYLAQFRLPRVTDALLSRLRQPDCPVYIIDTLACMRDLRTIPYLLARLAEPARLRGKNGEVIDVDNAPHRELESETGYPAIFSALRMIGEPAVAPLVEAANSTDPHLRRRALEALEAFDDPRALETLLAAVNDPDTLIRMAALGALRGQGDVRTYPTLIQALEDKDEDVRVTAAQGLRGCQNPRIIDPLARLLRSRDENVRYVAASTLADMDDPRVLPLCLRALNDSEYGVYSAVTDGEGAWLRDPKAIEAIMRRIVQDRKSGDNSVADTSLVDPPAEVVVPVLSRMFNTRDTQQRLAVMDILTQRQDAPTSRVLVRALTDANLLVQATAASALQEWCAPEALPELRALLARRDDPLARHAAIRILANMGDAGAEALQTVEIASISDRFTQMIALRARKDPQALPRLLEALHDPYYEMRETAARELDRLGDRRATEALLATLQERNSDVRYYAALALATMKDPAAVEPLIAGLQDGRTRKYCAIALCGFNDARATDALLAVLPNDPSLASYDDSCYQIIESLVKMGDRRVADRMAALLQRWQLFVPDESDGNVTSTLELCLTGLGELRDSRAIDACAWMLRENFYEYHAPINALADMGGDRALELLLGIVDTPVGPDYWTHEYLIEALGRITAEHVQDKLTAAAQNPRWRVRHAVVLALAQRAEPWSLPLLTAAQNDPQPQVSRAARQALAGQ